MHQYMPSRIRRQHETLQYEIACHHKKCCSLLTTQASAHERQHLSLVRCVRPAAPLQTHPTTLPYVHAMLFFDHSSSQRSQPFTLRLNEVEVVPNLQMPSSSSPYHPKPTHERPHSLDRVSEADCKPLYLTRNRRNSVLYCTVDSRFTIAYILHTRAWKKKTKQRNNNETLSCRLLCVVCSQCSRCAGCVGFLPTGVPLAPELPVPRLNLLTSSTPSYHPGYHLCYHPR